MSDNNDDTLLEGDLGDDVDYDLGNEDEDALLADDYEIQGPTHRTVYLKQEEISQTQNGFQREPEEPDDVLDLGVTEGDALDDLDSELQEPQEQAGNKAIRVVNEYHEPTVVHQEIGHLDSSAQSEIAQQADTTDPSQLSLEASYIETEQSVENPNTAVAESEEEEEETAESRDRFKSERKTVVSLKNSTKTYGNIPDSLDNVCVEDSKQAGRGSTWRGRRGRGFGIAGRGNARQHLHPGSSFKNEGPNNFNLHPHQDPQQQQGFGGPHFMPHVPGTFLRPPGRGSGRGIIFGRPGMEQQQYQQPPQQQGPHKILINPHFRGAVQPRPDARLIWDTEMMENQGAHGPVSQGDGFAPFPQGMQQMEPSFQPAPPPPPPPPSQGPSYVADQYPEPRYATPPQMHQGGFYHEQDPYAEQQHMSQWQDDPQLIGNDMYIQSPQGPSPMESSNMVLGPPQQEPVFHPHPNHMMNEHPAMTGHQGQVPGSAFGVGVVHGQPYQTSDQYHDDGNYPLPGLPPPPHVQQEQHYHHHPHHQQPPQPPMMSPGNPPQVRRLPPVMSAGSHVQPNVWHCTTDGSAGSGEALHMVSPTQPVASHYTTQGIYRLPGPVGMKIRQPGLDHQAEGFANQRVVRMGRFPLGRGHMKGLRQQLQQNRGRRPPLHMQQQPQQQPQQQVQRGQIRSPKKRQSFEGTPNAVPFKQGRFDPGVKRKKRMPDMSNLHEVQTVELPSDTQTAQQMESVIQQTEEEEDEETREYRKKIEEQKRIREEFLQKKEARRKAAARVKQLELQKKDIDIQASGDTSLQAEPPQGNAIATIVNRNTIEPQQAVIVNQVARPIVPKQQRIQQQQQIPVQGRLGTPLPYQQLKQVQQHPGGMVVKRPQGAVAGRGMMRGRGVVRGRGIVMARRGPQQMQVRSQAPLQQPKPQPAAHVVVTDAQQGAQVVTVVTKVPVPGQRIVRASGATAAASQQTAAQPRRLVVAQGATHPVTATGRQALPQQQVSRERTVVLRGANSGKLIQQQQNTPQPQRIVVASKQQGNTATRQAVGTRAVVATQKAANQEAVKPTKLVSIENLAASTTEQQLKRMCQDVGAVESIQMLPAQRKAVLKFANPKSALTFFQKYQRKIVDLSLITVKLVYQ